MLLLAKKKYAKKARYGFVNGTEPVNYVRDIRQRFEAYVELSRNVAKLGDAPADLELAMLLHESNVQMTKLRDQRQFKNGCGLCAIPYYSE